jgi:tRNA (guanine37-N1)-methyltransferase
MNEGRRQYHVITLFPQVITGALGFSILQRAQDKQLVNFLVHDLRDFTHDKHKVVDDVPYGGGPGMVLKPEPFFEALETIAKIHGPPPRVILLSPQGKPFNQKYARELAQEPSLALLCGRYEGVDERVARHLATEEISIGDYVLSGGEFAALVILEALVRLIPGVLGQEECAADSFSEGILDYPHYTRPARFRDLEVPEVLTSGNHQAIRRWRRKEALRRTLLRRPELLEHAQPSEEDKRLVEEIKLEPKE